ncbi:MAG: ATP-binding cassette domain-containing protein [Candidatus Helarchaeota archaeon]
MSHRPCLTVKNLTKTYLLSNKSAITALNDISFTVGEGEILGIIGRSGSGKTTLIRILRGVEPFDTGIFELGDLRITPQASSKEIRDLKAMTAIHLQRSFALWADSVLVNVMRRLNALETGDETADLPNEMFSEYAEMKERAMKLLRAVGLEKKAEHTADTLSGGEKQRLQLARQLAIAKKLKLLLLDEPLTMACPATKVQGLEFIKDIQKHYNITIIVASHYPNLLLNFVDRLIWLEQGQIKGEGPPPTIINMFLNAREELVPFKKRKAARSIIEVRDITREYYSYDLSLTYRMEKINVDIKEGEILGVVGPSGVGKTVFLQLLAGIDLPKEGEILYYLDEEKGINICHLGMDSIMARRQTAYVRQELDLTYNAIIKDLAAGILGIKGEPAIAAAKKRAKELGIKDQIVDFIHRLGDMPDSEVNDKLERLGLDRQVIRDLFPVPPWSAISEIVVPVFQQVGLSEEILDRRSQEISGGEKVRTALALALLAGPKVLILDEVGGDIDPLTLRSIRNLLVGINNEFNTTIITASHNIDFIRELSHRVIYLKEGQIIKIGTPDEVCELYLSDSAGI